MTSICLAYTIKVQTLNNITIYEDVYYYRIDEDYLRIYVNDGFDTIKLLIKKSYIISIEILND
jgi:hypothetical protein